eukprot:scaffold227368_cov13-Tisochrysis_lutea.AAC.1
MQLQRQERQQLQQQEKQQVAAQAPPPGSFQHHQTRDPQRALPAPHPGAQPSIGTIEISPTHQEGQPEIQPCGDAPESGITNLLPQ